MQQLDNISSSQFANSVMGKIDTNFTKVRNAINALEQGGSGGGGSAFDGLIPINRQPAKSLYDNSLSKMNVLAIGNSFTACSTRAFGVIANLAGLTDDKFFLQTYGSGGASLETICRYTRKNGQGSTYYQTFGTNQMGTAYDTRYKNAMSHDWDVILFQQNSNNVANFSTYFPWIDAITDAARRYCTNPRVLIGWQMIWDKKYNTSSPDREAILLNTLRVLAQCDIDIVVPTGTAFENARANGLSVLTDASGHTSNAAAEYVAAATWYQALFSKFNFTDSGESSDGSTTFKDIDTMSPTEAMSWNGGYQGGNAREISVSDAVLAAKCAKAACEDMWNVTLIS